MNETNRKNTWLVQRGGLLKTTDGHMDRSSASIQLDHQFAAHLPLAVRGFFICVEDPKGGTAQAVTLPRLRVFSVKIDRTEGRIWAFRFQGMCVTQAENTGPAQYCIAHSPANRAERGPKQTAQYALIIALQIAAQRARSLFFLVA